MFIRRADIEADGCPLNRVNCVAGPSVAIAGSHSGDPMDSASSSTDSTDSTTQYVNKPGPHRYIGIVMVAVLAFIMVLVWIWYLRRRKLQRARDAEAELSASSSQSMMEEKQGDGIETKTKSKARPPTPVVSEKERSLMLQSEPRGVIKEVSGGVVMFTEAPRVHPGKDRYPVDWEFEHVKGVRYEVSLDSFSLGLAFEMDDSHVMARLKPAAILDEVLACQIGQVQDDNKRPLEGEIRLLYLY